jgi:hypothetical protein
MTAQDLSYCRKLAKIFTFRVASLGTSIMNLKPLAKKDMYREIVSSRIEFLQNTRDLNQKLLEIYNDKIASEM